VPLLLDGIAGSSHLNKNLYLEAVGVRGEALQNAYKVESMMVHLEPYRAHFQIGENSRSLERRKLA
jgi:hypothetical protein